MSCLESGHGALTKGGSYKAVQYSLRYSSVVQTTDT